MRAASSCMKVGCMSMTDVIAPQADPGALEPTAAVARPERHAETPVVPGATISGRALVGVIAIMTFLASLTIGTVMLVRAAANDWQADVGREVTIQVRATEGHDIETEVARTVAISRTFPGVAEVRAYSKEETTQLLEPWLGSGIQFDELPVPRIIVMKITAGAAPDIGRLRKLVSEQNPRRQPRRPSWFRGPNARDGERHPAGRHCGPPSGSRSNRSVGDVRNPCRHGEQSARD